MWNKPLVVANWKMNGSKKKIVEDLECYAKQEDTNRENVIFAVPYLYLATAQQITSSGSVKYQLASQDVSRFNEYGAYTGEISASMLSELDIAYSIVGHSERRTLCGETDEIIMHKLHNLFQHKITPIYCIGESLSMRESGQYKEFLLKQLDVLLKTHKKASTIVVAYEPIWSIGTGIIPEMKQIEEIMDLIYAFVQKKLGHVKIAALYGGSVTSKNISEVLQTPLIAGVLVGGASLNVSEFTQICGKVNELVSYT